MSFSHFYIDTHPSHPQIELYARFRNRAGKDNMSNVSKTGQQEEGYADLSESNLLAKVASEDMIEGSERTNRVKEGT
jgi:hypothetical protein